VILGGLRICWWEEAVRVLKGAWERGRGEDMSRISFRFVFDSSHGLVSETNSVCFIVSTGQNNDF
jgi:hypothetical protein